MLRMTLHSVFSEGKNGNTATSLYASGREASAEAVRIAKTYMEPDWGDEEAEFFRLAEINHDDALGYLWDQTLGDRHEFTVSITEHTLPIPIEYTGIGNRLSAAEQRTYIDGGAGSCPFCQSENIEAKPRTEVVQNGILSQVIDCKDCEEQWSEVYKLTDVTTEFTDEEKQVQAEADAIDDAHDRGDA